MDREPAQDLSATGAPRHARGRSPAWPALVLWALLAATLAAVAHVALSACGFGLPGRGDRLIDFCPAPAVAAPVLPDTLAHERLRRQALQERLDTLRLSLLAAPDCPRPEPPIEVVQPPAPAPPEEEAEAQPPDEPPQEITEIPQEDWEDRDISFLEGCWSLISGMQITDVGTNDLYGVRDWQICFDDAGQGRQTIVFEDDTTCEGTMTASFLDSGALRFVDAADIPCSSGFRIFRMINDCERLEDGTAACAGRQPDHGVDGIRSLFRR